MNRLALELKTKRLHDELSTEKCAQKVGVSRMTIERVEKSGKAGPTVMKRLARYLKTPIDELRKWNDADLVR